MLEKPTDPGPRAPMDYGGPAALMVLGLAAVSLSFGIRASSLPGNHDPGPRLFPMTLGSLLALSGLLELIVSRFIRQQSRSLTIPRQKAMTNVDAEELRPIGWFIALFFAFLLLMAFAGFFPAAGIFSIVVMRKLKTSWPGATAASALLLAAVYGLFVLVFRVQLPGGYFN